MGDFDKDGFDDFFLLPESEVLVATLRDRYAGGVLDLRTPGCVVGNLIMGTNRWVAYDETGEKVFQGSEPLIGARDGERFELLEEADKAARTPRLKFSCLVAGHNKIRCLGHGEGADKMMAISMTLVRIE